MNYLITGATGVVGNSFLKKVLLSDDTGIVYLLVRAADDHQLKTKELAILNTLPNSHNRSTIKIIKGDISLPHFGIDNPSVHKEITQKVNIIFHAAANVRLNQPLEEARYNALIGTKNAFEFANACPKLIRIGYISTVGVGGTSENPLLEERVSLQREYNNTYEQAKAEAEDFIFDYSIKHNIPFTIYRPSMIVGHSDNGEMLSKQVFYYICDFLSEGGILHVLPKLNHFHLDTIPVNYLTDFILMSITLDKTNRSVFNVCSGHKNALSLSDLHDKINMEKKQLGMKNKKCIKLHYSIYMAYLKFLSAVCPSKISKKIHALTSLLCYLKHPPKFNNHLYEKFLGEQSIETKSPKEYLSAVLQYYLINTNMRKGK